MPSASWRAGAPDVGAGAERGLERRGDLARARLGVAGRGEREHAVELAALQIDIEKLLIDADRLMARTALEDVERRRRIASRMCGWRSALTLVATNTRTGAPQRHATSRTAVIDTGQPVQGAFHSNGTPVHAASPVGPMSSVSRITGRVPRSGPGLSLGKP